MSRKFWILMPLVGIATISVSCVIDIDVTDLTERRSTLNFENPEDFEFDPNYVEIKNNEIALKALDPEHSGDDFSKGSHVGTYGFGISRAITRVYLS